MPHIIGDVRRRLVSSAHEEAVRSSPEVGSLLELIWGVWAGWARGCFEKVFLFAEEENLDRKLTLRYSSKDRFQRRKPAFKVFQKPAALDFRGVRVENEVWRRQLNPHRVRGFRRQAQRKQQNRACKVEADSHDAIVPQRRRARGPRAAPRVT